MSVTSEHETLESRPFVCRSCRHSNPAPCRFCGKCGERLWEPCLGCGETNPCNVTYCGHCGTNVQQAFEQRLACIEADQQKAERLRADGMYYEAIGLLSRLESGGDSRLERLVQVAQQRAEELRRERVDRRQEAEAVAAIATQRLQQKDYTGATDELARVPLGMRDQGMQTLWSETQTILREIADLTAAVRRAHAARDYDQLLPLVLRLQELCPQDAKLARLLDDLQQRRNRQEAATAEHRLQQARELLGRGDYTAAAARLTSVSTAVLTSEQRDTYDKIRELGWITSQLKTAGAVTPQLASMAQRLTEMYPQDERATRVTDELTRRLKMRPSDVRFAVPWGKLPDATRLGCPVRWWRGIQVEASSEAEPWLTARDRLMVAYGLALQGLGVSRLKLNLLPPDRASWLKRWTSSRSPQSCNQVWGIDLGTSGLKAVELSRERQSESIQLIRAVHLPHRRPLNSAEDDGQVTEICRETVQRFVEQCQLARSYAVVGFPGPRSLGRSFEIPPLKAHKLADVIAYEARLQIPVPLDEIIYDWHAWPLEEAGTRMQSVTMLAARQIHVERLLESLSDSPIVPIGVQSDCLALYNAAAQQFWRETDGHPHVSRLALLEVGVEASNLVLASPHWVRYRSIGIGTEKMTRAVTTRFQMTRAKAEAWRERPAAARWMYQLDEELTPLFAELVGETQRTLAAYQNDGESVDQLLLTGGGASQHGLLRHFVL